MVGDSCEEVEFEVATDDSSRAQYLFGFLAEAGDAASDDLPDAGGQSGLVAEVDFGDPSAVIALSDDAGLGEVPDYSAVGLVRSSMWAAAATASRKPRTTMTTVMIVRTIESPIFCEARPMPARPT